MNTFIRSRFRENPIYSIPDRTYSVSFLHSNTNFRHPIQAHAVGNGKMVMSWTFLVFESRHLWLYSHKINFCFALTEAVWYEVSHAGSAHALYPYKIFVVFVWEDRLTRSQLLEKRSQLVGQLQFIEETRHEPSHPSKVKENGKWTLDFFSPLPLSTPATQATDHFLIEFSQGKLGICGMYSEVGKMENTEFPRICRFVKLLVNEGFLAVKTGCKLRESNSIIRKLLKKCKHMCIYGNIVHAFCWCQSQTNPHFKRLYASPKSNFSQFWRHLLTEPLSDCLVLFLKSPVDNLEDRYTIFTSVLYLHNGFKQSK